MIVKISFFKALFSTCSGLAGFRQLRFQSWLRVICHVILAGFLAALLITSGEVYRKRPVMQAAASVFQSVFGKKLLCTANGLVPEISPGNARTLILPDNGKLWYSPSGPVKAESRELESCAFLILWFPRGFATAVNQQQGNWTVSTVTPADDRIRLSGSQLMTTSQLQKLHLDSGKNWDTGDIKEFSVSELMQLMSNITACGLMIRNLAMTLLLPLLYTGIFVGMFRLTSGGRYPIRLTLREFWKIGFYAGFPAMLVASAFPALDLPFLSFSTVYMVGLLAYWLCAAAKLERELAFEESGESNEQH